MKEDVCLSLCLYTNCARRSFLEIGLENNDIATELFWPYLQGKSDFQMSGSILIVICKSTLDMVCFALP